MSEKLPTIDEVLEDLQYDSMGVLPTRRAEIRAIAKAHLEKLMAAERLKELERYNDEWEDEWEDYYRKRKTELTHQAQAGGEV